MRNHCKPCLGLERQFLGRVRSRICLQEGLDIDIDSFHAFRSVNLAGIDELSIDWIEVQKLFWRTLEHFAQLDSSSEDTQQLLF